eukprot:4781463-Alexandrium_andersonii.AAC.1
MSASLVGSEMCIRDRVIPHVPEGPAPPPRPRVERAPRRVNVTQPTVSYTHLTLPTICSV